MAQTLIEMLTEAAKVLQADRRHALLGNAVVAAIATIERHERDHDGQTHLTVQSLLSHRTKAGMVNLTLNQAATQMDLSKAREVHRMLGEAIEAAVSDQLLYAFLTQKVGLDPERAAMALGDFREGRHGSRELIIPS